MIPEVKVKLSVSLPAALLELLKREGFKSM